jgi:hypothetical protein
MEYGRRRGRPAESLPAEPPCLANALLLSPAFRGRYPFFGSLMGAQQESQAGRLEGSAMEFFFLEYTT